MNITDYNNQNIKVCPMGTDKYVIAPTDTFYKLSRLFNTTIDELKELNPEINPERLKIGQEVCVPVPSLLPCTDGEFYTVQDGDTLYKIAKAYGISLDKIIQRNPFINPNLIYVGQQICVPYKE
ncbi:LysM peptidoglycan-binding domain-containing protein [Clostridium sp. D2Q-11]|uniref:LysM peptidoglycan-binding domain-containing protein n=1 Tax=Anaeromonas frigoriresistens TaxID=2683708 RepID=A0A942Z746_9FIRM|nr:LysM domain-containing protein [Anaeromonas frigoriresistens]MBS4539166.1 LysM peptidoglycan-binding domain-containing protein [Anaeromonas frigoriresistens]